MKTKTLSIGGCKVAYYESPGRGPSALLIHSNSQSGLSFEGQLESPQGEKFRLIAIDLPGHGFSDPSPEPDKGYTLPGYAEVVRSFTEELGLSNSLIVGSSLGGHIAIEATSLLPEALGFMIYGAPPIGYPPAISEAFLPSNTVGVLSKGELTDEEVATIAASLVRNGDTRLPDNLATDIRRTDPLARVKLMESIGRGEYTDEIEAVKGLKRPIAILHGEDDQIVNATYLKSLEAPTLWRGEVQVLDGAGHMANWDSHEAFNTLLEEFIEDLG